MYIRIGKRTIWALAPSRRATTQPALSDSPSPGPREAASRSACAGGGLGWQPVGADHQRGRAPAGGTQICRKPSAHAVAPGARRCRRACTDKLAGRATALPVQRRPSGVDNVESDAAGNEVRHRRNVNADRVLMLAESFLHGAAFADTGRQRWAHGKVAPVRTPSCQNRQPHDASPLGPTTMRPLGLGLRLSVGGTASMQSGKLPKTRGTVKTLISRISTFFLRSVVLPGGSGGASRGGAASSTRQDAMVPGRLRRGRPEAIKVQKEKACAFPVSPLPGWPGFGASVSRAS